MISLAEQCTVFLQVKPVDFRKGIDSLVGVCRRQLDKNPFSGAIFAFRNRKNTAVKLLLYDGSGFWLMHKRFSKGKLTYLPKSASDKISMPILTTILNQGTPGTFTEPWRPLDSANDSMVL